MIVFELILELIGRFVVEILFEVVILGIWKLIKKAWRFLKYQVFGFKRSEKASHSFKGRKGMVLRQPQAQRGNKL